MASAGHYLADGLPWTDAWVTNRIEDRVHHAQGFNDPFFRIGARKDAPNTQPYEHGSGPSRFVLFSFRSSLHGRLIVRRSSENEPIFTRLRRGYEGSSMAKIQLCAGQHQTAHTASTDLPVEDRNGLPIVQL